MDKLVWRDYWRGFAWSNIKAYYVENKGFAFNVLVACLVTIPNYIVGKSDGGIDGVYGVIKFLCIVLPYAFAAIATGVTMIALPKALYMSPMEVAERKAYVAKKWKLAVLVPNVVNAVGMIIGWFTGMELWSNIFFVLSTMLVHVVAVAAVIKDGSIDKVWLMALVGVMLFVELPLYIKLMSYKQKLILSVANYEVAYDTGSY